MADYHKFSGTFVKKRILLLLHQLSGERSEGFASVISGMDHNGHACFHFVDGPLFLMLSLPLGNYYWPPQRYNRRLMLKPLLHTA